MGECIFSLQVEQALSVLTLQIAYLEMDTQLEFLTMNQLGEKKT